MIFNRKDTFVIFFNGTEDWWREAYDGGRGKDYIGNLYFNEQTQAFSLVIATPVMDREGIEAIGVLAIFHDVRRLLDSMKNQDQQPNFLELVHRANLHFVHRQKN